MGYHYINSLDFCLSSSRYIRSCRGQKLAYIKFPKHLTFPPFEVGFGLFVRRYSMYLPFIPHAGKLYSVYTGKPPWPTFKYYVGVCLEGLRKSKKNSSHSSRRPGRQERYHPSQFYQWFSSLLLPVCTLNCSSIYYSYINCLQQKLWATNCEEER
jgi:hypothetical protein